jgi:hypothetical protein
MGNWSDGVVGPEKLHLGFVGSKDEDEEETWVC